MKAEYLIDSIILIDHLNGISKATNWLSKNKNSYISVITRAEILSGADAIDPRAADKAAELRKKYGLKLPDALQASLSILNNVKLATRGAKDFKKDLGFVKIPYKL